MGESEDNIREVIEAELFDVSVVTYPAYTSTTAGARSLFPDGNDLEQRKDSIIADVRAKATPIPVVVEQAPEQRTEAPVAETPVVDAPAVEVPVVPVAEVRANDNGCECDCEQCVDNDCANCSDPECDDPNCDAARSRSFDVFRLRVAIAARS
jgi:hypothetical protein